MKVNCVFCKINSGEIKEEILYRDDKVFVVRDINPRTPFHLLIITKTHFGGFEDLVKNDPKLISHIGTVIGVLVEQFHINDTSKWGYTWGFHCGGKESVAHVHAQLLAETKEGELVL
ncbi:HIT domain-containing protein [Candidatus Collierbacteria bacterium]|nr:HIT domain-containing protein [Candidatus Collierbacteria bacterium]